MDGQAVERAGAVIADLATTVEHNLSRDAAEPPRFEGRAQNRHVDPRQLPAFRAFMEREGQAFLERCDEWLSAHEAQHGEGRRRPRCGWASGSLQFRNEMVGERMMMHAAQGGCAAGRRSVSRSCSLACGGGGGGSGGVTAGIDRGGIVTATGAITGFGSVHVNGVHYVTTGATITIDDNPGTESDLRVGQVVRIEGRIEQDGINGTATRVIFDDEVEGPVQSIDLADFAAGRARPHGPGQRADVVRRLHRRRAASTASPSATASK